MSEHILREIINQAVADYGFRLAVMWGADDVIKGLDLTSQEARTLTELIVPELKKLPNPVEPRHHDATQRRLAGLAP